MNRTCPTRDHRAGAAFTLETAPGQVTGARRSIDDVGRLIAEGPGKRHALASVDVTAVNRATVIALYVRSHLYCLFGAETSPSRCIPMKGLS